ncbi:MAG: hypothetical protein U0103_02355 [Candidatus Obscuribacterales bacterium]|nr:hypothetical protein [Cyanobacteria bacterium SZAS LIN-5]RTL40713.1 MAG: hypothetical protein EKK48_15765 [Candidatus Melainabacteria bacterium]
MKAPTIEKKPAAQKKKASTKKASAALATCPVNGAGWCPYPFTVEQLERRLREKAEAAAEKKSRTKGV